MVMESAAELARLWPLRLPRARNAPRALVAS
jgi:hypothetical protein